jgi:hypothetical protein
LLFVVLLFVVLLFVVLLFVDGIFSISPEPPDGLSLDMKGAIASGTAVKLLYALFDPAHGDVMITTMLLGFRSFATPLELFAYVWWLCVIVVLIL